MFRSVYFTYDMPDQQTNTISSIYYCYDLNIWDIKAKFMYHEHNETGFWT